MDLGRQATDSGGHAGGASLCERVVRRGNDPRVTPATEDGPPAQLP